MSDLNALRPVMTALLLGVALASPTALHPQERAARPAGVRVIGPIPDSANGAKGAAQAPKATHVAIGKMSVVPDLQVTMSPQSKNTVPTQFIVKNSGFGKTDTPTVLWVAPQLKPMKPDEASCTGDPAGCALILGIQFAAAYSDLVDACGIPMKPIQTEIPPLEPGQSHTVTGTAEPVSHKKVRLGGRPPDYSYVKSATLVCVFEIVATVDGSNAVNESNEKNNESRQRFEREIAWH